MEPHVREQLQEARAQLDRALAASSPREPAELARLFGRLGQLYQAYDLTEPAEASYRRATELAPEEARWHYYQGLLQQRLGRGEASIQSFERALALTPDDPPAILRLADLEREGGHVDRAESLYRRLLELEDMRAAALHGLGRIATARGDHAAAVASFEGALVAQPSATRLHFHLGMAYRRLGEIDKAREQLALQGSVDVAFPDPLLAEIDALASGAAASLQRGYAAAFAGALEPAIRDYRRAVAADPANPEARRSLAGALADAGDYAGAIEQLRELLLIDPNPAGAHFTLAETLEASGDAEEALTHYAAAVERAPGFRVFRLALGRALARAGRLEEAAGHLRRLTTADPHDAVARIDLAEVLLENGQVEAAAREFEAVLAGDPRERERAAAERGLGELAARAGSIAEAETRFQEAVRLDPEDPASRLVLANLLGASGRFPEAATAYRRVIELDPESEPARLGEATALVLAGSVAEAIARLEEGLEALPGSAALEDTLARLLAATPAAELRDGPRALALAAGLFERLPTLQHAETLAMALAESGRFDEAAEWQRRVLAQAERLEDPALIARARDALASYRNGRPHRLP